MAREGPSSRWRCPECGTALEVAGDDAAGGPRLRCPDCGGRFGVRRKRARAERSGVSTDDLPVGSGPPRPPEPPPLGVWALAVRGLALRGVEGTYRAGVVAGSLALFALGGFVPVLRGWLRDEIAGWPDVVGGLGGVWVTGGGKDPDADLGPVLGPGDAPALFGRVAEVARRVGVRPPDQVRLTYLPCCGVVAWRRSRALVLGLPLFHVLTLAELGAVVAHELAHLARGDVVRSDRSERFAQALARGLESGTGRSRPRGPLRLWARMCSGLAASLRAPIAQAQEARADRAAAAVAGGTTAAAALVKVAMVQPLFREVLDRYDPDQPGALNLYAFFREFWGRLPEPLREGMRLRLLTCPDAAPDPAHPALAQRLVLVQAYPDRGHPAAERAPASTLLADPEALEQMLHNRLFGVAAVEPTVFHEAGT